MVADIGPVNRISKSALMTVYCFDLSAVFESDIFVH